VKGILKMFPLLLGIEHEGGYQQVSSCTENHELYELQFNHNQKKRFT
jgi:hypothetical protein